MISLTRIALGAAALTIVSAARLDAQAGTIRVTIAGGPHAGTYEMAERCKLRPALYIMASATGTPDPKAPTMIEFIAISEPGKPQGFAVTVRFPETANGWPAYEIDALPPDLVPGAPTLSGRGTMTVRQTATGRTATFRGQTKDGVRMEGTMDCRSRSS